MRPVYSKPQKGKRGQCKPNICIISGGGSEDRNQSQLPSKTAERPESASICIFQMQIEKLVPIFMLAGQDEIVRLYFS